MNEENEIPIEVLQVIGEELAEQQEIAKSLFGEMNREEIAKYLEKNDFIITLEEINNTSLDETLKKEMMLGRLASILEAELQGQGIDELEREEQSALRAKMRKELDDFRHAKHNETISEQNKEIKNLKKEKDKLLIEEDLIKLKIAKENDVIDVDGFRLLFGYGDEWQKKKRALTSNPLPVYGQTKKDGSLVGKKGVRGMNIRYDKSEVESWLDKYIYNA